MGGLDYLDNLNARVKQKEDSNVISIGQEVDRIYLSAPEKLTVSDEGAGVFTVEKTNLPDLVLCNPWVDKAKATADFGDDEYHDMVCLEPALAGSGPCALSAGASWSCCQKLT